MLYKFPFICLEFQVDILLKLVQKNLSSYKEHSSCLSECFSVSLIPFSFLTGYQSVNSIQILSSLASLCFIWASFSHAFMVSHFQQAKNAFKSCWLYCDASFSYLRYHDTLGAIIYQDFQGQSYFITVTYKQWDFCFMLSLLIQTDSEDGLLT